MEFPDDEAEALGITLQGTDHIFTVFTRHFFESGYVYMGVSENNGTPKSSILIGFSINKPSILGYCTYFLETSIYLFPGGYLMRLCFLKP